MTRRIALTAALIVAGASLVAWTSALAQSPVGGSVPSLIGLTVGTPTGFVRVGQSSVYDVHVPVAVTSTVDETQLSVADGEDLSGPAHGHLHDGTSLVRDPLTVSAGRGATQSLSAPFDPLVASWSGPLANQPVTIVLSQRFARPATDTGTLQKVLLITVSTQTP